jgi:hypothetical protein
VYGGLFFFLPRQERYGQPGRLRRYGSDTGQDTARQEQPSLPRYRDKIAKSDRRECCESKVEGGNVIGNIEFGRVNKTCRDAQQGTDVLSPWQLQLPSLEVQQL